jgi:hypothetical protein
MKRSTGSDSVAMDLLNLKLRKMQLQPDPEHLIGQSIARADVSGSFQHERHWSANYINRLRALVTVLNGIAIEPRSVRQLGAGLFLLNTMTSTYAADPAGQRTAAAVSPAVVLNVEPVAGSAPLTVRFSGTAWTGHSFDPGDGTIQDTVESGYVCGGVPGNLCLQERVAVRYGHTYQNQGTFIATLRTQEPDAPKGSIAATATVVVAK